jgi:hypothetical protein
VRARVGALNGVQFIQKAEKLTHLFAFADKLRDQYAKVRERVCVLMRRAHASRVFVSAIRHVGR